MLAAAAANDFATARTEQYRGVQLIQVLLKYGFLAAAKELMRLRGVDLGGVRMPHVALTSEETTCLRRDLDALGFPGIIGASAV
jgi:N-acetylneuraminate lyase